MRLFSSALVLIVIHFFKEIEEASGFFKRIITDANAIKHEEDRRNILATPRHKKLTASTQYSTSRGHQVLDRHGDDQPPYILESSHQLSLAEASDLMNKFKTNKKRSTKTTPSTKRIQRDQIQHPNLMENDALQQNQANSRQGSVDRFNHYYGERTHPVPQSGDKALSFHDSQRHPNIRNSNKPLNIPEGQGKRISKTEESSKNQRQLRMKAPSFSQDEVDGNTLNLHATTQIGHPNKKYSHLSAEVQEARRIYSLPFSQHSELIQQKPFHDNQPLDFKKQYREEEALKLFDFYYPNGVSHLEFLRDHPGGSGSSS